MIAVRAVVILPDMNKNDAARRSVRIRVVAIGVILGVPILLMGIPAAAAPQASRVPDGCSATPPQVSVSPDKKTATAKTTLTCTLAGLSVTTPVESTASGQNCETPTAETKPGPSPTAVEFTSSLSCEADTEGNETVSQTATASPPLAQARLKVDSKTRNELDPGARVDTTTRSVFSLRLPGTPVPKPKWVDENSVEGDAAFGDTAIINIVNSEINNSELSQFNKTTVSSVSFGCWEPC